MYYSLQACRAVAAALVVLFHLGGTFAQDRYFGFKAIDGPFAWGDAGVDFFFVLSGFLITTLHRRDFGRPQALGAYVSKRLLRIYPTYWLACMGVCVAALAVPSLRDALPSNPMTFFKALALWPQDPAVVGGLGSPILFVAWSLQYEMLFYAFIAVAIVSRAAAGVVAAALLLVYLGCAAGGSCDFPSSFLSSNMIFLFVMGVACSYLSATTLRLPRPLAIAAAAAAGFVAFGLVVVHVGHDSLPFDRRLIFGALSAVIILGLVQAEKEGWSALRKPWVALSGDASYALYLIHIPVISAASKALLHLHVSRPFALVCAFAAVFAICVASAILFHVVLERPLLKLLRRGSTKEVPVPGEAAGRVAQVRLHNESMR